MMSDNLEAAVNLAALRHRGGPRVFDAVVIGAGAAGGLAAELLTTAGLDVLLLDAGYSQDILRTPPSRLLTQGLASVASAARVPSVSPALLTLMRRSYHVLGRLRQPIQTQCYAWDRRPGAFVDDIDCPYDSGSGTPFLWIRCRGVGGRLAVPGHGRLYLRFTHDDFRADGDARPAWPFSPSELDPWYAAVETRLGLLGGDATQPACLAHATEAEQRSTTLEEIVIERLAERWPLARPVRGRRAAPADTVDAAQRTGRLALRQGAVVRSVLVNDGRVTGAAWFDQATQREERVIAKRVFLCASALESTRILLLSRDESTGRTIGAESNALGNFLMDHVMVRAEAFGAMPVAVAAPLCHEPHCVVLPRFDARSSVSGGTQPGFTVQLYAARAAFGRLGLFMTAFHEMRPRRENRVTIEPRRLDRWGIPVLRIDCSHGDAETAGAAAMRTALGELAAAMGTKIQRLDMRPAPPGLAIHECGTARMGDDPTRSVVDSHNECWDARGLYVTDAAAFPSQGSVNPSLTIMALTARACAHALASR